MIGYRQLNVSNASLTAAVPNNEELITQIQGASHPWMETSDDKDMFFHDSSQKE